MRAPAAVGVGLVMVVVIALLGTSQNWFGERCHLSAKLVPSCGALLGITPSTPDLHSLRQVEAKVGHDFALVYTFHDINDPVPTPFDRQVVNSGATLHLTIDARDYSSPSRASVTWQEVAAGRYDPQLRRQASGIAALHEPVFVTFDHESDQPLSLAFGTPTDFVRAWRHVHDVFDSAGARNAVWVWVMLGWQPSFRSAARMWPGNSYVDWISWDAYDTAGCRTGQVTRWRHRSFAEAALPFLAWLHRTGPRIGIDIDKPLMISETGTLAYKDGPAAEKAWFEGLVRTIRRHPDIKAVTLWDHTGSSPGCDFRFSSSSGSIPAIRELSDDSWFNSLTRPQR